MLGRFTAGILAVILFMLIEINGIRITGIKSSENMIDFALESFISETERTGVLTLEAYENLIREISDSGINCIVGVKVGTVVYTKEGNMIETVYTDDILETLYGSGGVMDVGGNLITVYAQPLREGTDRSIFVYGGYING